MAETGYNWSAAWSFVQESSSDWDGDALADNATDTSDPIDLDLKAAARFGITAVEDNTGAINGVCTVYILGEVSGNYEEPGIGSPYNFTFTPIQNDTVYIPFALDPKHYHKIKIAIKNESGQELAISVEQEDATVPVAS